MKEDMSLIVTRADEMPAEVASGRIAAVLSIEHPGSSIGRGGAPRLDDAAVPQKILCFWDSEQAVTGGPDMEQVKAGLQFIMDHQAKGIVLIHCHAGVARSTAMALGAMALLYPDAAEKDLVDKLLEMRPQAAPNILVLEMLDQLTNRGGRLVQAVKDHPVLAAQRLKCEESRKHWIVKNPEAYKKMHPEKFPEDLKGFTMAYWLIKSEPSAYAFQQMLKDKKTGWTGVRNYQAANNMKAMQLGDECFFYHSNEGKDIVGIVKVLKTYHADPTDETGKFGMVEVGSPVAVKTPVSLSTIKAHPKLQEMSFVKQSRLSVSAVTAAEWNIICKLAG